jgi:hypothetical protein
MLPKLSHPTVSTTLPSSGRQVKFRPMLAKEEKVLLHAKESTDDGDVLSAVAGVVQNCVVEPGFHADELPVFDVEHLFLRIRMASVSPIAEVAYIDRSDQKQYDFQIDLDKVEMKGYGVDSSVKVTDDIAVELRWPSVGDYLAAERMAGDAANNHLVLAAIGKVYQGDEMFDAQKYPREELQEFVDSLPLEAYHKVTEFVDGTPHLYHEINYTNSKGEARRIVLTKLQDFFAFR